MNSGPLKTHPPSGREEDLNLGPPDYKSSALPLGHARLGLTIFCYCISGIYSKDEVYKNCKELKWNEDVSHKQEQS